MPGLVSSITKLFAGDTKIVKIIRNRLDVVNLQIDVDKLVTWAKDWQMSFNVYKCKYMIFQNRNYSNLGFDLTMNEAPMTTYAEKDLGIYITSDLKWSIQAQYAANKANTILCQLRRAFKYWTIHTFKQLPSAFARPHLEYAIAAWNP